jgi:all-trans-8'-apo-beta-carotenal 15,15'-oxygenase
MFRAGSLPPLTNSLVQPKKNEGDNTSDQERFVTHPFDADGAIFAATFGNSESHGGEVTYRYRYIRTAAFDRERKKGKKLYNAMEPTRTNGEMTRGNKVYNDYPLPMIRHHFMPGANKQRKNTSNTNVIYWANKLLSFWEGGLPYKLDGLALSTDGKSQLGGVLREETHLCSKAVHDANKNRMLLCALNSQPSKSVLTTYEFNDKFKLVPGSERDWNLPGYAILNDGIACTESWNVVIHPPVTVNGMQYLLSKDPAKCLNLDTNSPTLIHLIPRSSGKEMVTISMAPDALGPDFNSQCVNAYQELNEVVLDVIRSSGANSQQSTSKWPFAKTAEAYQSMASSKSLWRYRVDVSAGKIVSRECLSESQLYLGSVNPSISGKKHNFVYAAIGGLGDEVAPPQGIAKIKCDTKEINVSV